MKKTILIVGITVIIIAIGVSAVLFLNSTKNIKPKTEEPVSYIGCGCGCCVFDKPLEEIATIECLYKSKGESIQDKINQDRQLSPDVCAAAGCSFPVKYVYCD